MGVADFTHEHSMTEKHSEETGVRKIVHTTVFRISSICFELNW